MDVDARKLLELALPELRDYALILLDADGRIVAWLCGSQDILGYSAEEVIGQPLAMLFVQEDVEKGLHAYELELAREDSTSHDDRWHVRKDGTRIWVAGTVTALKQGGELLGYAKVLRDRTDLRMVTEARANELSGARAELQRLRLFVNGLGRELRSPLAPLGWIGKAARALLEGATMPEAAGTGIRPAALVERLAVDLTDVSRLQSGAFTLHRSEFDLCPLLREECAAHEPSATGKGLKLEALLPHAPLPVDGDAERLRQAMRHLLANALKYTPRGGTIWVKATQEDDEVVIRIEDSGIGIDPAALQHIFELFTREERAKEIAPGYLGVGLAIVRHIARLHGGVVQARSGGAGKGAEFTLRLPRSGQASA